MNRAFKRAALVAGGMAGAAALLELGYVAGTWYRYGRVTARAPADPLLDRFMPRYEVAERHEIEVAAPVDPTFAAARQVDLQRSRLVRAIFAGRELMMRSRPPAARESQPLVDEVLALGWRVLAEEPGRELVLGAVTRPWEPDVTFRGLPPEEFAAFEQPGYTKIVWTLVAEPAGPGRSVCRTETRVVTTDAVSRERFRRYWAIMSPGIRLIRWAMLRVVKRDAERRVALTQGSAR
jgi:hypothetical protein